MRTIKEIQRAKGSKAAQQNNITSGVSNNLPGKIRPEWPEEFEEDRNVSIRIKPQPLFKPLKKKLEKKRKGEIINKASEKKFYKLLFNKFL